MINSSSYLFSNRYSNQSTELLKQQANETLFGKSYHELTDRFENKNKMTKLAYSFFNFAAITHVGSGASFFIKHDETSLFLFLYSAIFSAALLYTPYLFSHRFGFNAEDFLKGCNLIEKFHYDYNGFKSDPNHKKISALFQSFKKAGESSNWLQITKYNQLLSEQDLTFLQTSGKFFLMNEIFMILSKKHKSSPFLKDGSRELQSTKESLIKDLFEFQKTEIKYYESFKKSRPLLNCSNSSEKMRLLFIKALDRGLDKNII